MIPGKQFGIAKPVALSVNPDEIKGWVETPIAWAMTDLIHEVKPEIVVEIGVFAGRSLVVQAAALKDNGKGVIYGIDSWYKGDVIEGLSPNDDPDFWDTIDLNEVYNDCVEVLRKNKLDNVALIRCASWHCAKLFHNNIDILYIDGSHSEAASCRDVELYLTNVRLGGYIWIDDTNYTSLQRALHMLQTYCLLEKDFGHAHLYKKIW
jgi:Methyltransferase domain